MGAKPDLQHLIETHIQDGRIVKSGVHKLLFETDLTIEVLLLKILDVVQKYARPAISEYSVGAAALGASGTIYVGMNVEFAGTDVSQTIHAEQCTVINAAHYGERHLQVLTVTAPPCGVCRQFLYEVDGAADLDILLEGAALHKLPFYLPEPFGPQDLNVTGGLLSAQNHAFSAPYSGSVDKVLSDCARKWANRSYAPYTQSYAGVALGLSDGQVIGGGYIENAAFNPSLAPIKSAICRLFLAGKSYEDVTKIHVAQFSHSKIDHVKSTQQIMENLGSAVKFSQETLTAKEPNNE
ncbi:cytidine deaminase [Hellea sp.]|nr:cytidine deaminase [Hellea sp.]